MIHELKTWCNGRQQVTAPIPDHAGLTCEYCGARLSGPTVWAMSRPALDWGCRVLLVPGFAEFDAERRTLKTSTAPQPPPSP